MFEAFAAGLNRRREDRPSNLNDRCTCPQCAANPNPLHHKRGSAYECCQANGVMAMAEASYKGADVMAEVPRNTMKPPEIRFASRVPDSVVTRPIQPSQRETELSSLVSWHHHVHQWQLPGSRLVVHGRSHILPRQLLPTDTDLFARPAEQLISLPKQAQSPWMPEAWDNRLCAPLSWYNHLHPLQHPRSQLLAQGSSDTFQRQLLPTGSMAVSNVKLSVKKPNVLDHYANFHETRGATMRRGRPPHSTGCRKRALV
jgi:hypothetical protein